MTAILIITRPAPAGPRFVSAVAERMGHASPVIYSPAFRIDPVAVVPPEADHLILTSQNGVAAAQRLGISTEITAWCVGDRTAAAAREAGFSACSAGGDAAQLVDLILSQKPNGRFLHLAGKHRRGDISGALTRGGVTCDTCIAYEQVVLEPTPELLAAFAGNTPLVSPVFSPRSASPFAVPGRSAPLHGVAMSGAVAEVLTGLSADTVHVAERPDELAMIAATSDVLTRFNDRG